MRDPRLVELENVQVRMVGLQAELVALQADALALAQALLTDADRQAVLPPDTMTIAEAAREIRRTKETVRRWRVRDGEGALVGGQWRVRRTWLRTCAGSK